MPKVRTMKEAIEEFVPSGSAVAMGCGLESAIPFAAGHELARQHRDDLTVIGPISDMLFDLLTGAGCVSRVVAAWVGNVGDGLGHNFRRAVEQGVPRPITVEDHSNLTLALGLQAAAWGVPYLPTVTGFGTDLLAGNPRLRETSCPFTGRPVVAVEAIRPDVAILHVQRADRDGNAHLWGNLGVALEAARAATRVIITCEELVAGDLIRSDPNRTLFPGFLVSAVVREPWGAHPSPLQGYTRRDDAFYVEYHEQSRSRERFLAWLDEWVRGVPDRAAYLRRLGDERQQGLRITEPLPAAAVNYGWR